MCYRFKCLLEMGGSKQQKTVLLLLFVLKTDRLILLLLLVVCKYDEHLYGFIKRLSFFQMFLGMILDFLRKKEGKYRKKHLQTNKLKKGFHNFSLMLLNCFLITMQSIKRTQLAFVISSIIN